jgi:outer membrane lipoprotein-sorting protein
MRRYLLAVCVVVFVVSASAGASALEFSSDMVMTSQGQTHTSKVWAKENKFRMESGGQPGYTIMRVDKSVTWMVMPEQKAYMEMKLDPSKRPRSEEKVQGEVSRKLIGSETANGHPAKKYEVTYTEGGKTERMYQWIATDINFPVRMAAIDGSWVLDYKNIKMAAQPDSLFEVPSGYQKTAMPGLGSFGRAAPEAAGEQAEKPAEPAEKGGGDTGAGGLLQRLPKINLPKW